MKGGKRDGEGVKYGEDGLIEYAGGFVDGLYHG